MYLFTTSCLSIIYEARGGGEGDRLTEFALHMSICVTQHIVVDILKIHDKELSEIVTAIQHVRILCTHFT
jgi:hypothetical protein